MNLLKINKNIKIIATYYKNKIKLKNKNIIIKKIDIEKDLKTVKKIITKYHPLNIYYFSTPKILAEKKDKNLTKLYNKFYNIFPLKIIKFADKFKIKFFYPSTVFSNKNSSYVEIKKKAEKNLSKLKLKNSKIDILKIHPINTNKIYQF